MVCPGGETTCASRVACLRSWALGYPGSMSAGDLAVTLAALLCALGFAALVVVLVRVLDALGALRREVDALRSETKPLLAELRASTDEARSTMATARSDLDRFDRVIGSAEAISDAMQGSGRVARNLFSTPVIKVAGLATGTSRAVRRLKGTETAAVVVSVERGRSVKPDRSSSGKSGKAARRADHERWQA